MVTPIVFFVLVWIFLSSSLPLVSEEDSVSHKEKIMNRVVSLAKDSHLSDCGQECN